MGRPKGARRASDMDVASQSLPLRQMDRNMGKARMPPKIRELIRKLLDAGFVESTGKGSHRKFRHPGGESITLSGASGNDAKPYQVNDVNKVLGRIAK